MSQGEAIKNNLSVEYRQSTVVNLVHARITQFNKMAAALQKLSSNKAKQSSKSFVIHATHLEKELQRSSIDDLEKEVARVDTFVERTKKDAIRRLLNRADYFEENAARLLERKTSSYASFDHREVSKEFLKQARLLEVSSSEKSYYKIEKAISEADEFFNTKKGSLTKIDKQAKREEKGRAVGKQMQKMASSIGIAVFTLLILVIVYAVGFVALPELFNFSNYLLNSSRW